MKLTKEEYLEKLLINISNFQTEYINSSQRIMEAGNSKLFALDFMALSVNNRAISLSNAYVTLVKDKNYLSAISLVRLQLDNALRFFGSTLVNDSHDFASHFLDGKPIKDYVDIDGKKLSDNYLAKKLETYFKGTQKIYEATCGYIHLSDRHFSPTLTKSENKGRSVGIKIGSSDNFKIEEKIDFTYTMLEVCKLVLIVVEQWKHEKVRLSEIYDNRVIK